MTFMVIAMRDFTRQPKVIEFKIDQDIFRAKPRLPAQVMIDFSVKAESIDENADASASFQMMSDALEMVLMPDDYRKFVARMSDTEQPIDLPQINDVIEYVMEEYGMRPTSPPSDSSGGPLSPDAGTSSTASTQDVVSTSSL